MLNASNIFPAIKKIVIMIEKSGFSTTTMRRTWQEEKPDPVHLFSRVLAVTHSLTLYEYACTAIN